MCRKVLCRRGDARARRTKMPHGYSPCLLWRGGGLVIWSGPTVCTRGLQTQPLQDPCAAYGPGSWPGCEIKQQVFRAHTVPASHSDETVPEQERSMATNYKLITTGFKCIRHILCDILLNYGAWNLSETGKHIGFHLRLIIQRGFTGLWSSHQQPP